MGRNGQPIDILTANGKKHFSKEEIQQRKDSEVKVGTEIKNKNLRCPDYIKNDLNAFKKWKEIIKIYKDVEFVSSGDVGFLARYCMTHSEYLRLLDTRNRITSLQIDWGKYRDILPEDFRYSISELLGSSVDLQLEAAINKKVDLLIKMEDRSFLNPLAKVKNVPQKPKEEKAPGKFSRFGAGKSG